MEKGRLLEPRSPSGQNASSTGPDSEGVTLVSTRHRLPAIPIARLQLRSSRHEPSPSLDPQEESRYALLGGVRGLRRPPQRAARRTLEPASGAKVSGAG